MNGSRQQVDDGLVIIARALFGFVRNALDALGGQSDRQQPPLEAIVVEGFAKAWGDHDADTASQQCADRMFTRRPAAKIIAREQNGRRADRKSTRLNSSH